MFRLPREQLKRCRNRRPHQTCVSKRAHFQSLAMLSGDTEKKTRHSLINSMEKWKCRQKKKRRRHKSDEIRRRQFICHRLNSIDSLESIRNKPRTYNSQCISRCVHFQRRSKETCEWEKSGKTFHYCNKDCHHSAHHRHSLPPFSLNLSNKGDDECESNEKTKKKLFRFFCFFRSLWKIR